MITFGLVSDKCIRLNKWMFYVPVSVARFKPYYMAAVKTGGFKPYSIALDGFDIQSDKVMKVDAKSLVWAMLFT